MNSAWVIFVLYTNTAVKYNNNFFRAIPAAYRCSQAKGQIGVAAVSLRHSHCHIRSEPCLQPMLQLIATRDP